MNDRLRWLMDAIITHLDDRGVKTTFCRPQQLRILRLDRQYLGRTVRSVLSMMQERQLASILNRLESCR